MKGQGYPEPTADDFYLLLFFQSHGVMEYARRGGEIENMETEVSGRLKYAKAQAVKYPELERRAKAARAPINEEIHAKTAYEQKQKRVVSVSKRFVGTAATIGLPMRVLVNGVSLLNFEANAESVGAKFDEVCTELLQYLDANKETTLKIVGVLG